MAAPRDLNPFRFSGPLAPEDMIDRDEEADDLLALAEGGHSFRLVGPRRYGKTTLLRRVLEAAERDGIGRRSWSTCRTSSRSPRSSSGSSGATSGSRGRSVATSRTCCARWNIGLSLGGGGFTATLQRNPHVDAESVLLRLLELPASLFERQGTTSLIVFDEIQDVLAVQGADGKIRSVIQHQTDAATYAFAGSAPGRHAAAVRRSQAGRCSTRRCRSNLEPLPLDEVGEYVERALRADADVTPARRCRRCWSSPAGIRSASMMLAHYLWERTARGATADEGTWLAALDQAAADAAPLMRAIWRALTPERAAHRPGDRRRDRRRSTARRRPRGRDQALRASAGVESLVANAGVMPDRRRPRLTDPMFEHWLRQRGLVPAEGGAADEG